MQQFFSKQSALWRTVVGLGIGIAMTVFFYGVLPPSVGAGFLSVLSLPIFGFLRVLQAIGFESDTLMSLWVMGVFITYPLLCALLFFLGGAKQTRAIVMAEAITVFVVVALGIVAAMHT